MAIVITRHETAEELKTEEALRIKHASTMLDPNPTVTHLTKRSYTSGRLMNQSVFLESAFHMSRFSTSGSWSS